MSTRRSSRSRRQAHTIYDDARAHLENSSARKKQRTMDDDSEMESQHDDQSQREPELSEDEQQNDESKEGDTSDTDEPFEKPTRKSPAKARNSTTRPVRVTPAKPSKQGKSKKGTVPSRRTVLNTMAATRRKILKENETAENSILAGLLEAQASPSKVARRVAQEFAADSSKAVDELAQLIFRSVGGGTEIPFTDWEHCSEDDLSQLLSDVVKGMEATPPDQVLLHLTSADTNSRAAAVSKEYRKLYEEFWRQLASLVVIEGLGADDGEEPSGAEGVKIIMERLMNLAHVGVTDIRAAATLALYQMGFALVERSVDLGNKLTTARRQLEAASNQARKKAALTTQIESYEQEKELLDEMIQGNVISAVFMKRYKDINPHIRATSIELLSQFMILSPKVFLKNIFLKYIGWLLSDKNATVRDCAVQCFKAPIVSDLDSDDVKQAMEGAVTKFLPRLCDCVLDVDSKVQESTMELFVILMKKGYLDSLDDDAKWDQLNLRALAADASPKVRYHALMFVIEQLEPFDKANSRDSDRSAVEKIKALVQWIVHMLGDGDIPLKLIRYELVDFCVISLRSSPDYKSLLCNWSAMLKVLETETTRVLQSSEDIDEQSDRREDSITQRVILRMLATAIEMEVSSYSSSAGKLLEGTIDGDLAAARKALQTDIKAPTKKKNNDESSSHEELTSELLLALPELLIAYKADSNHGAFNLSSRRKHFLKLVDVISDIFLESTDTSVLSSCVLTLTSLCSQVHSRSEDVRLRLKRVARSLQDRLLELLLLKSSLAGKTKNRDKRSTESAADIEQSICLCLRRLQTLSQRLSIVDLLVDEKGDPEEMDKIAEDLFTHVSEYVAKELQSRKIIPVENDEGDGVSEVPKIWEEVDDHIHQTIANSIREAITCLLTILAWRLQKEIAANENQDASQDDYREHIVVRMRDRLLKLLSLCFEQYLDAEESNYSNVHIEFSIKVQTVACRLAGDVRALLPKAWQRTSSPFLAACALIEDDSLIGGTVRFLQSQEAKSPDSTKGCDVPHDILLSMARGLAVNWKTCNRREAGMVFAHLNDENNETKSIISSLSSVAKTIDPYRLLEAHLACLTQSFDGWLSAEPEEPESDRPSEEEMESYDEACASHRTMFKNLDELSRRLSASLGKAKLSKTMILALRGFFRAGVEYAFLAEDPFNEGEEVVGMRLAFLRIIAKYLSHIKGDSDGKKRLLHDLNAREEELRQHPDFDQILDEDREALSAFRKAAGFKSIRLDTQDTKDGESDSERDTMDDRSEEKELDSHGASLRKSGQAAADSPLSKQSFHSQSSRSYSMHEEESVTQHEESLTPRGLRQRAATDDSMSDSL
ncbi:cohesin complex subunit SA-1/2 [Fistulifera solaris]|uniref:Cohesin complex subunit SA-1/2 n=1 Tax=Fistulifera solaris TaxID=1519565 RepID=A0A1Z5KC06_FISSO|nr:cohesin complex subunit SA-1/2 [Fistulifera solaris]|eukprot:GAX23736.1 cohesin complex subunit SA-1/2 [Fistulifera solaris]